jgi:competence protein ComEA
MSNSERQIRGIVAITVTLAIIPFFVFVSGSKINYQIPEFTNQFIGKNAAEVIENGTRRGIYFVDPGTSLNQLLKSMDIQYSPDKNFLLDNGIKITVISTFGNQQIAVNEIELAKRLALGLPLDINRANESDLLLITGIGEATAKKILELRSKLGRYKDIEQLTEIKGIKEKKLEKLRPYLYVKKI